MEHPIPNPLMILPFGALLLMVALAPLFFADWWHHHYPKVAIALGAVTIVYYLIGLRAPGRVVEVAHEYFSFIALIGSLFLVARGLHHNGKRRSYAGGKRYFFAARGDHREPRRHDRRFDAADPSVDSHEQISRHRPSHRVLYLYRLESRRLPHAHRRPAAFYWFS